MSLYKTLTNLPIPKIQEIITKCDSKTEVLRCVGFKGNDPRARTYLTEVIRANEINIEHFNNKVNIRLRGKYSVDDLKNSISSSLCMTDVLKQLGLSPVGGNGNTITRLIELHDIDISHFNIQAARRRNRPIKSKGEVLLEFKKDNFIHRTTLRSWVLRFKIIEYKCDDCDTTTWKGKELTLDLDHKDGDRNNNGLNNLRFLCPNCHSLTETYRGKNNKC